ncbi:MAG TPA: Maf family protein [Anaerolineales bacterium]
MIDQAVLLLASNSPRRQQLLALGSWTFRVAAADVDESHRTDESPQNYVIRLAEAKARAASRVARGEQIVIGADTTVVDGAQILGKPAGAAEAGRMLKQLRGHSHKVYTGLAALRLSDGKLVTDLCVTDVPMRTYTDEEIDAYVRSRDPLDKAGAYAIQHASFDPVESMAGCYASVMGLPLCHLVRTLRELDLASTADVPMNCQTFLDYQCPVSSAVLRGEQVG